MDSPFINDYWSLLKCYYYFGSYSVLLVKNVENNKMYIANPYKTYKNTEEWLLVPIESDELHALENHEIQGKDFLLTRKEIFVLRCTYDDYDKEEMIACEYESLDVPSPIYQL